MDQQSVGQLYTNNKADGLDTVYELLSAKQPIYITANELMQKGFTQQQTAKILEIIHVNSTQVQQIDYLTNEAHKPVLEQRVKFALESEKAMNKSGRDTMQLVEELKNSLISNATGTLSAFNRVIAIYTIAFSIGVALIAAAVVFGAMGKTVLAVSFGAIGLIDIITYFIKLPADKIQESRSNLSQLQVVLLVWMKDLINNEALCTKLLNTEKPSIEDYKMLSEINIANTAKLLKLIETMAEPKAA